MLRTVQEPDYDSTYHKVARGIGIGFVLVVCSGLVAFAVAMESASPKTPKPLTQATPTPSFTPRSDPELAWLNRMASSKFLGYVCADGWRSPSTGRGTCSHHGGIQWALWDTNGSQMLCPIRSATLCP